MRHRLEVYRELTAPLVDFADQGLLRRVEADGEVTEVAARCGAALGLPGQSFAATSGCRSNPSDGDCR